MAQPLPSQDIDLSFRQRLTWGAHFFKALFYQYHRAFAAHVRPLLPRNGIVVDVGAHAGQFAKLFSKLVPHGRVYAFEPGAYALSILVPVVRLKGLSNVRIVQLGLSDRTAIETLHVPLKRSRSLGFGLAHLGEETSGRETVAQTVHLTTLDSFVREHQIHRLDFIKADIEGWETHLLRGGMETIRAFRPSLMLEIGEATLARAGAAPEQIFNLLAPLGYQVFRTDEHQNYRLWRVSGFEGTGDYLFVPQEKAALVLAS